MMRKTRSVSLPPKECGVPHQPGACAFTLIEVLAATAVLSLLLVLTLQILSNTNTAIRTADRRMDASSQARAALDRIEADFSTALLGYGATAICTKAAAGGTASIGFLCRSRAREAASGSPAWLNNLRGAVVGYRIRDRKLERGDGRFTFSGDDLADHAAGDLSSLFTGLAGALNSNGALLEWNPLGEGIVRFHISYQLDNGDITQTPPEYAMTSPQDGTSTTFLNGADISPCTAIAFSTGNAPSSGDHPGRYVKALIIGVAAVDRTTLALSKDYLDQLDALGTPGVDSSPATDTALVLWERNLGSIKFPPLRQNIRFYQRILPVIQ